MSDIDEIKLRRLDLTVLLIFLGLMRHRKAVRVADEMGLTQSSISHALKRLRDVFGDELFLRRPFGLEPTAVAIALEPKIASVVETLDQALRGPQQFDPTTAQGVLRLTAFDYELATLVPFFAAKVGRLAPGLRLVTQPLSRSEALGALREDRIDLAVGLFREPPDPFVGETLFVETYSVVARHDHAIFDAPMTPQAYAAAQHLLVSPRGDLIGVVDDALRSLSLERRVAVTVPLFLPALAMLRHTNLIATVPRRLALMFADQFGLRAERPPIDIRSFPVAAIRHSRDRRNPMHVWATDLLRQVADEQTGQLGTSDV